MYEIVNVAKFLESSNYAYAWNGLSVELYWGGRCVGLLKLSKRGDTKARLEMY